ncbi:MAG: MYXO-CTERM sorting domain-containing protein, partial [Myxococcota bacterium]
DPEDDATTVLGVVPYTPKCQVSYHAPELLKAARWQWGDGQTSEGFAVEHTVEDAGNYSVTMCADVLISEEGEEVRTECVTKTGYMTACDVPEVSFAAEQVDGLTWQLKNRTDVSTYGCLTNLSWEIYDESGALVETLKTWEPEVDFPAVGTYRVVLNVGGYAGVVAEELTIEAKRGVSANCSSVGGTAGFGLFGLVLLAAGMRRRRDA